MLADKLRRFRRHPVLDVLAGFPDDGGIANELPRREIAAARPGRVRRVWEVEVETLILRLVVIVRIRRQVVPQVPLAEVRRGVARLVQRFGQREVLGLQPREAVRGDRAHVRIPASQLFLELDFGHMAHGRGDADPRRVLAGQDARPRRRAERVRGVRLGELHATGRKSIEIWRLVIGAAETVQVAPAEIVGEDEDDIWPAGVRGTGDDRGDEHEARGEKQGGFHEFGPTRCTRA